MANGLTYARKTASTEATKQLAETLAPYLHPGDVVVLSGDLGAGKTQFVQGVAAGLGISAQVTSPTFNILLEYHQGRIPLYHFDLYRLDEQDELVAFAMNEYGAALDVTADIRTLRKKVAELADAAGSLA